MVLDLILLIITINGMQKNLWNRFLTEKVIKDTIHKGHGGAARKHKQELAAAGFVVKNGRPRKTRKSSESSVLTCKRSLPKALALAKEPSQVRKHPQVFLSRSTPASVVLPYAWQPW